MGIFTNSNPLSSMHNQIGVLGVTFWGFFQINNFPSYAITLNLK